MLTLTEKIQNEFIGSRRVCVRDLEERLTQIVGHKASCYDSKIDDGVDEDETEEQYVMADCFDFEGIPLIVRIYYGDVTQEIGYVDVAEEG